MTPQARPPRSSETKQKIDVTAKVAEVPDDRLRREGPAKPLG